MDEGDFIRSAAQLFRRARIFRGLEEDVLLEIARISRPRSLVRGQVLVQRGEAPFGFFLVASGSLSLRTAEDRVLALVQPGETFAEGTLVAHRHYPVEARAEQDGRVLIIDRGGFLALMKRHPALSHRVMDAMGRRMRILAEKWSGTRTADSESRVLQWLLAGARKAGGSGAPVVRLPATKKLLAAELGIAPETLSRCLARLRDRGQVRVRGREVTLLDQAVLRRPAASAPAAEDPR